MSGPAPLLCTSNLGKAYKRYARKYGRLAEWLGLGRYHEPIWVLREVSLEVRPGEALGIVGVNGAGKSTLLKIITGTTRPTTGRVQTRGRIAALLELGMGFDPEFTGRQNCFLSGQLHGLRAWEIEAHLPAMRAFAEIGDWFDQPVRTYSSGMQVRLAFSLATAVRPEILIVDEALSVGDMYFQHKCIQRIRAFQDQGTALLLVSHAPETVRVLCSQAIMLEEGRVVRQGAAPEVMDYYRATQVRRTDAGGTPEQPLQQQELPAGAGAGRSVLQRARSAGVTAELLGGALGLRSGDTAELRITAAFDAPWPDPHIGFGIRNRLGVILYETNTYTLGRRTRAVAAGERLQVTFRFACHLHPDTYDIMIGVASGGYGQGSFEHVIFFDQSFMVVEVLAGALAGWSGLWNLQPEVEIR